MHVVVAALLVAQVGAAQASPPSRDPPCGWVVRGAVLGTIAGAVATPILFAGSMWALGAVGCRENCEPLNFALLWLTVPSIGAGAILGGGIGALIGHAIQEPTEASTE